MATPIYACGGECGSGGHILNGSAGSFSTTTFRSGLRALRTNPTAAVGYWSTATIQGSASLLVARVFVRFATLPDTTISICVDGTAKAGAWFNSSDNKIYCGNRNSGVPVLGSTGYSVSTGQWYLIEIKIDSTNSASWTVDVQVDGQATDQQTINVGQSGIAECVLGSDVISFSGDIFFDDLWISQTSGDYPLGSGYIVSYIPNADGTHGGTLGSNEVERSLTGIDITTSTTDAYLLVDDRPLEDVQTDFINYKTNGAAGDYIEVQYENSVEPVAPRSVEAIVGYHDAGGAGTQNFSVTLRDSNGGTTADIVPAATRNVGATMSFIRKHFTTIPGGGAWTLTAFNALRSRFACTDASPDVYLDGLMLEAEYAEVVVAEPRGKITVINQSVQRAGIW